MQRSAIAGSVMILALFATGCAERTEAVDPTVPTDAPTAKCGLIHDDGPTGGVVFDVGEFHAEFTADHDSSQCIVYFFSGTQPRPIAADELSLSIRQSIVKQGPEMGKVVAPMIIRLRPIDNASGKAATFRGRHPGLANYAKFEGTIVGEVDGRSVQGHFKE